MGEGDNEGLRATRMELLGAKKKNARMYFKDTYNIKEALFSSL